MLLAVLSAVGVVLTLLLGASSYAGPLLVAFFLFLAVGGASAGRHLGQFRFTLWIFAGVSLAMVNPEPFIAVGDFRLDRLIVPLIQVIMFGMGTALSVRDFAGVLRMPKAVLVGSGCQFLIMPLLGAGLAMAFRFPPEVAAGVVLIGSAPGGVASNVMAYIAGANLPLSVSLTIVSTLLSPLMTPLMMKLLAGQYVAIDFLEMMLGITRMVILPVALGLIVNRLIRGRAEWLHRLMPLLSMAGIAVIITIITAAGRDALLEIGATLVLAAIIHNGLGYLLGYWGARAAGMDERTSRTISIEVGMQNGGLASGIAMQMGKVATVGLAPAIFGPWMNISGSVLANWWRNRPAAEPEGAAEAEEARKPVEA